MTRAELIEKLFDVMSNDICVMSEHEDSEESLMDELQTADDEILASYKEIFLN